MSYSSHFTDPIALDALLQVERLPVHRSARCHMVSSYNRNYWNDDSKPLYLYENEEEGTVAEMRGPGCIYRLWSGGYADARFFLYFDGEERPRVTLRFSRGQGIPETLPGGGEIFLTSGGRGGMAYPPMMLTGAASDPNIETGICYMPMPFRKSCRLSISPSVKNKFFQMNWHSFPQNTQVETFNPQRLSSADIAKIRRIIGMWYEPGHDPSPDPDQARNLEGQITLKAGEKAILFQSSSSGTVRAIHVKLPQEMRTEQVLRGLVLTAYWDGEKVPSIYAAMGPFFNDVFGTPSNTKPVPLSSEINRSLSEREERNKYAFGLPYEYHNYLFGYTREGGYYTFFPMPYAKGARLELLNNSGIDVGPLSYRLEYEERPVSLEMGRFCAFYHRENPTVGIEDPTALKADFSGRDNYVILRTTGRGHYIGASLFMIKRRDIPENVIEQAVGDICEGNEMIFVDDDPALTHIGTGTEDYANQNFGVHDHIYPFDGNRVGFDTFYRLHISDCIPFRRHIEVTIEHGAANAHFIDYSSVAYWYRAARY